MYSTKRWLRLKSENRLTGKPARALTLSVWHNGMRMHMLMITIDRSMWSLLCEENGLLVFATNKAIEFKHGPPVLLSGMVGRNDVIGRSLMHLTAVDPAGNRAANVYATPTASERGEMAAGNIWALPAGTYTLPKPFVCCAMRVRDETMTPSAVSPGTSQLHRNVPLDSVESRYLLYDEVREDPGAPDADPGSFVDG